MNAPMYAIAIEPVITWKNGTQDKSLWNKFEVSQVIPDPYKGDIIIAQFFI